MAKPSLWFVVPAHGRVEMARICLTQLARTCEALGEEGIDASAVVIADDENLETAKSLGFAGVKRPNSFLSRKFNDGIQLAGDRRFNSRPADFIVPCGTDDFIDHRILTQLPRPGHVTCFRQASFVNETGDQIVSRDVDYEGGVGIRIYTRATMGKLNFRPADEDRKRGCDTSILVNLKKAHNSRLTIDYRDIHYHQIVDWKSGEIQLNSFEAISKRFRGAQPTNPFEILSDIYPAEALDEMRKYYESN